MLKGIANILKTMGEAFTLANTGDMLNTRQKADVLTSSQKSHSSTVASPLVQITPVINKDQLADLH
ncbi:hypothetical protein MNBD_GAMMA25-874 [hydrothermal vent metagenome]|uniref:Uncharacterized protein n=1 Tax=hydrothermal vent metagenome TaxID=652676 RepID=A0A3B1BB36_9ZZZZ